MSEYQYYEFLAIDRPLSRDDQAALRSLSSRARISAVSFANHYDYGDFKGDPAALMAQWFDVHVYFANWGTRQLMLRWPRPLAEHPLIARIVVASDFATLTTTATHSVLDITVEDDTDAGPGDYWDDDSEGTQWLAGLAPLREDVAQGDLRLFYLVWLLGVAFDAVDDAEYEPLPGLGPITEAIEAFGDFFGIDSHLLAAAAARPATTGSAPASADVMRAWLDTLSAAETRALLDDLLNGVPGAALAARAKAHATLPAPASDPAVAPRTAADLRAAAAASLAEQQRAAAAAAAAERQRREAEAARQRAAHLAALAKRGDAVWDEVEAEIARRNAAGYTRATTLLTDLAALARINDTTGEFEGRLDHLRARHATKPTLLARLAALD